MKMRTVEWKHKGKPQTMSLAVPESLREASITLGEEDLYTCFLAGYIAKNKKEHLGIKPKRKRFVRLNIEELTPEQYQIMKPFLERAWG